MDTDDYYPRTDGKRWWFRLHEKNGVEHEWPAHHNAEAWLDEYIAAAGIAADRTGPLWRTLDRHRRLTDRRMDANDVLRMVYGGPFNCPNARSILRRGGPKRATAIGLPTHVDVTHVGNALPGLTLNSMPDLSRALSSCPMQSEHLNLHVTSMPFPSVEPPHVVAYLVRYCLLKLLLRAQFLGRDSEQFVP
jgi:hypothetical protein